MFPMNTIYQSNKLNNCAVEFNYDVQIYVLATTFLKEFKVEQVGVY